MALYNQSTEARLETTRSFTTHYDNLQVAADATRDEIRHAYKRLCQRHHPDKAPGDPRQAYRFQCINRAWAVLSDERKRQRHDRWIERKRQQASNITASNSANEPLKSLSHNKPTALPGPRRKANLRPYREVQTTLQAHRKRLSDTARQRAINDAEIAAARERQAALIQPQKSAVRPIPVGRLALVASVAAAVILIAFSTGAPPPAAPESITVSAPAAPSLPAAPAVTSPLSSEPPMHSEAWVRENIF